LNNSFEQKAGSAMVWRAIQLFGIKGIFLVRMLILARLLFPEDFGLVAIATSATGFLMSITNVGLIPAVVQAEEMDERRYAAVWTFDVTRSFLVAALAIIFAPQIADVFAESIAVPIIRVLALRPFFESLTSIKVTALNRNLSFRPLAYLKITEAIVSTTLSIALASYVGVWALVLGTLGGTLSMVVASYILAPYRPHILYDWQSIKPLMNFGWWVLVTSLVSMAGNYGLRIAISRELGAEGLGLYFIATQLAYLPNEFARELVGGVAFPLFARLQRDVSQATRAFRALFSGMAVILYPICALLIVVTPVLTHDILGPKWEGTEDVIRILTLIVMVGVFGEVAVTVFRGFGQIYRITILEVVQSSVTIGFVWMLTRRYGLVGAALAWAPAILLSQLLCAYFLQHILEHPFRGLLKPFSIIIVATSLCVVVALAVSSFIPGIAGSLIAVFLSALFAAVLLWVADRHYELGFARNLALVFPQIAAFVGIPLLEHER
jgi:O-antigen/teichoic acid export membrane protein